MWLRSLIGVVLALPLIVVLTNGVRSADFQDPQAIRLAIRIAAEGQYPAPPDTIVNVEVGEIDSRLRLPACPLPQVSLPMTAAPALTAKVSCDQPSWTFYVPVRLREWSRAVVAAANLAPNTRLAASDLTFARIDAFAANGGFITDPAQAEGKILRGYVRAGAPILAPLLDLPMIVHRGDTVLLTLSDTTMTIKANVVAMEDGRQGDSILVQNADTRKTMRAVVSDIGGVEMRFNGAGAGRP
jgi:flagellar basal body P-ring formation protein FlgA